MKLKTFTVCAITIQLAAFSHIASAVPSGFVEIISEQGVKVYKKDYSSGNPDYVQVIDLSQGARIKLMRGNIASSGSGQGAYGGDNPSIYRQSLSSAWNSFSSQETNAVCITNGQFFATNANPTTLAFPVVINSEEIDGYGSNEFYNQKQVLEIYDGRAEISAFPENVQVLANNSIVGLSEDANKGITNYTGRTFVGVSDKDYDGYNETVLIFNSKTARQPDAAQVLRDFGASDVAMLDGGGSTQLICDGQGLVTSSRTIPQTIGVVSGETQSLNYEEKCNFVFDELESSYSNYFSNGSSTRSTSSGYYRYYRVSGEYNYLYAYNDYLWYKIGGNWYKSSSIEDWYAYLSQ